MVAATAAGLPPAAAWSATTTTYHGTFNGPVAFLTDGAPCADAPTGQLASGQWRPKDRDGRTAMLSVDIFVDGAHHMSFGAHLPATSVPGATFAASP